jgi:DNA-directed RNA polymerase specialized sigma24 family protein
VFRFASSKKHSGGFEWLQGRAAAWLLVAAFVLSSVAALIGMLRGPDFSGKEVNGLSIQVSGKSAMETLEQTKQAADLHWLATLLTGCREIAVDVTRQAMAETGDSNPFFSTWMMAWSRRLVIAKALSAVREDLAASARRTASRRTERSTLPPRSWVLDRDTTRSELERALLSIEVFPRAAVLLSVFERVPLKDAAILLDTGQDLVRNALAAGVRELTINLAIQQGWKTAATKANTLNSEWEHA